MNWSRMEGHIRSNKFQTGALTSFEPVRIVTLQQNKNDLSKDNGVTWDENSEMDRHGKMDDNQVYVFKENGSEKISGYNGIECNEEIPNAVEFLSIECDTILEPDCTLETGDHLNFTNGNNKKHKRRMKTFAANQGANSMLPIFYQIPSIAELFRYRSVDVYKRMHKDGPFVKIFNPESCLLNGLKESKVNNELGDTTHRDNAYRKEGKSEETASRVPFSKVKTMKKYGNHIDEVNKCNICHWQFDDKVTFMTHMSTHVSVSGKSYPCTICEASFTNKGHLKSHMQRHLCLKSVQCQLCDEKFTSNSQYVIHLRTHVDVKSYQCQYCGDTFAYKFQFDNHERKCEGNGPLKCNKCEATFTEKQALVVHKMKHTDERPYKCDKCSAAFRYRKNLRSHRKHHNDRKPQECPDCGSQFWKSSSLKRHRKSEHNL